jgi:capsular exopolysaccharide synthesis family protein
MEFKDYVRIMLAHWLGVVLLVLVGLAGAAAYNLTQPKVYEASATGIVSNGKAADTTDASIGDGLARTKVTSYAAIATSTNTAEQVLDDIEANSDDPTYAELQDLNPSGLTAKISVSQPLDTALITINARDTDPARAAALANAWVAALAQQVSELEGVDPAVDKKGLRLTAYGSSQGASQVLPRTSLNLAVGLLLGLVLGFAYAMIRHQFDRRLRSAQEVEKQFGVPVIGLVPQSGHMRKDDGRALTLAVTGSNASASASTAEAFRKLRTNLQFMDVDNPPQIIVVTSPRQGDGKSTVAANLAAAMAVNGQPVTLIDGDLRRPTVAESFGLVEGAGLTDVLVGRVDMDDVAQQHPDYTNLRVLAAGGTPPNPSELLGTQAMRKLLRTLARTSVVLIDAPPLLPVTDAAVLTALSDGALVVISSGKTLDTELGAALGHLDAVNGKALGVIFNRVTRNDSESGYYGEYYGSTPKKGSATPAKDAVTSATRTGSREPESPVRR